MRAAAWAIVATAAVTAGPACAGGADPPAASGWNAVQARCDATAAKPASALGRRIAQTAIDEFTRFGGHRIDADGRLFRFGLTEAEHEDEEGGTPQARLDRLGWWQVMKYWQALFGDDTAGKLEVRGYRDASTSTEDAQVTTLLRNTAARLLRLAEDIPDPEEREVVREAALRAAITDTSWSAAFISYVVRQSGGTADTFRFANAHAAYIYDAFATGLAEADKDDDRLYRACPITTTKPRLGDLICNQREPAFAEASERAVRERIRSDLASGSAARSIRRTHCEVVAYVDARARKVYTIGGNVNQAVAARKLNLRGDLRVSPVQHGRCARPGDWTLPEPAAVAPKPAHHAHKCSLNDRKWFVLLQLR